MRMIFYFSYIFFFFFKQKTAYEMRISDWSSDVCSSDLHGISADQLYAMGEPVCDFRGASVRGACNPLHRWPARSQRSPYARFSRDDAKPPDGPIPRL